jgi:membrane protein
MPSRRKVGWLASLNKPDGSATSAETEAVIRDHHSAIAEFVDDLHGTWRLAKVNSLSIFASSVAFFCIFSLMPFLILCFVGSRFVLGVHSLPESSRELSSFFQTMVPNVEAWLLEALIQMLKLNAFSNLVSTFFLGCSTYGLFTCLHTVFSKISVRGAKRNAFISGVVCLICFIMVGGASTLFFMLFTTSAPLLKSLYSPYLDKFNLAAINYLASAIALFCVLSSVTFIYKFMPTQKVDLRFALKGSLLFMGLFLSGRLAYQVYSIYYRSMNQSVYGSFVGFILVVVWIYYLSYIFLFSAQYAIYLEEKRRIG